jgi:hypothetical protein
MSTEIAVHGYGNNGPKGARPRKPLVHMLGVDENGTVNGISFHPDHAGNVIAAIRKAAKSAKDGRKVMTTVGPVSDDQ